jgi:hypothetical protein
VSASVTPTTEDQVRYLMGLRTACLVEVSRLDAEKDSALRDVTLIDRRLDALWREEKLRGAA